ncbi:MAG: hypothetical protein PWQ79_295 [Thermococcaceae archaeon]|nr:hypothetical protein [Thermococcaceae archaeon]MDK2913380.1 hypothetical protein [Thermococcaceae archaeon]
MLLLTSSFVSSVEVSCPSVAHPGEMTCNVTGDSNEKFGIYLSSVNGFALEPSEVLLRVNSSGDVEFAWYWKEGLKWFYPPAQVKFEPEDALYRIVREFKGPFSGDIRWMFLGKESTFTLTVVYPDGRSEKFTAKFVFAGKPDLKEILSDYLYPSAFLFIVLSFLAFLFVMAVSLIARTFGASPLPVRKSLYLSAGAVLLFILVFPATFSRRLSFTLWGQPNTPMGIWLWAGD